MEKLEKFVNAERGVPSIAEWGVLRVDISRTWKTKIGTLADHFDRDLFGDLTPQSISLHIYKSTFKRRCLKNV